MRMFIASLIIVSVISTIAAVFYMFNDQMLKAIFFLLASILFKIEEFMLKTKLLERLG